MLTQRESEPRANDVFASVRLLSALQADQPPQLGHVVAV
jgi:hypothetical protein